MNLPNSISVARIVAAPLLAVLPFVPSVSVRVVAFFLYLATAISDHVDGVIARNRGLVTDLGKILDPLADKLLLLGTFVPMFILQAPANDVLLHLLPRATEASQYPFVTWLVGPVHFPWWVLVTIVAREAFMTWFREYARKRGLVIAAQRLGKYKAGFQYTWMGASFCWFGFQLAIVRNDWTGPISGFLSHVVGAIGSLAMSVAFVLTLVSLGDYLIRHRSVFAR
ncbi:MAG: CDP-alcohol phosphatidyltransferase family protein [Gemmatimonadaceae bacterium]